MIYGIALCVHLSPSKGTGCVYRTIARALEGGQYDALHEDIRGTIKQTCWEWQEGSQQISTQLSAISLINGLSLGLKRTGKDLEGQAKEEEALCTLCTKHDDTDWRPVTPAK